MSLQVWLPLTKQDLRNQGLAQVTSSGTPSYRMPGKLSSNALDLKTRITFTCNALKNLQTFSVCFWGYAGSSSTLTTNWQDLLGFGDVSSSGTAGTFRWETTYASTNGIHWHDNATNALVNGSVTHIATKDTWCHCCVVFDYNAGKVYSYTNGVLTNTYNHLGGKFNANGTFYLGETNNIEGMIQDVRFYNHALSSAEVKKISQGLILHYPLNFYGLGSQNLLQNTHFNSQYTQSSGWDTSKNGTLLANLWGGYNSGVANQATVYHAHLKEFHGEYVYEYIKTANESWLGISQGGLQDVLQAGETYTFSWEEYHVNGTNRVGTGLYYYKTGASSANFHLGIQQAATVTRLTGQWQRFSYTFTAPTDADWTKNMSWYIYGHYNNNGTFYLRHPKLEYGSTATPWVPGWEETYVLPWPEFYEVYDCSGFGNNGHYMQFSASNNNYGYIQPISNFPKYEVATQITSINSTANQQEGTMYLYGACGLNNPTEMSIAFWLKPIGYGYGNSTGQGYFCTTNYPNNYVNNNYLNVGSDYQSSAMNHRDSAVDINDSNSTTQCRPSFAPTFNEWHHYVITYDGQVGRVYKDGVQSSSAQFSSAKTLDSFEGVVLGFSKAGGVWRRNNAHYSDLRVYATCLSANDVKSLYQNEAYIDTSGTVYGQIH